MNHNKKAVLTVVMLALGIGAAFFALPGAVVQDHVQSPASPVTEENGLSAQAQQSPVSTQEAPNILAKEMVQTQDALLMLLEEQRASLSEDRHFGPRHVDPAHFDPTSHFEQYISLFMGHLRRERAGFLERLDQAVVSGFPDLSELEPVLRDDLTEEDARRQDQIERLYARLRDIEEEMSHISQ